MRARAVLLSALMVTSMVALAVPGSGAASGGGPVGAGASAAVGAAGSVDDPAQATASPAALSRPDCSAVSYSGDGSSSNPYEVATYAQLQCIANNSTAPTLSDQFLQVADIDASATLNRTQTNFTERFPRVDSAPQRFQLDQRPIDAASVEATDLDDGSSVSVTVVNATRGIIEIQESTSGTLEVAYATQTPTAVGFAPLGNASTPFNGTYDGNGYRIVDLLTNRPTEDEDSAVDSAGLFGRVGADGTVRNVALVNVTVRDEFNAGGLAGVSQGRIESSYATGRVTGTGIAPSRDTRIGGLVGENGGTIVDSNASVTVSADLFEGGSEEAGGLVGRNTGTIARSHATGDVTVQYTGGGLVGISGGTVENSYATGNVSVGSFGAGGLVGELVSSSRFGFDVDGVVRDSYATGTVEAGSNHAGGLVGQKGSPTDLVDVYATGDVTGEDEVGGLVGETNGGDVVRSYATGDVTSEDDAGGLIGVYDGPAGDILFSNATGNVTGNRFADDVGGLVGSVDPDSGGPMRVVGTYAAGDVTGDDDLGGLLGDVQDVSVEVFDSYARGNVTGVGGDARAVGGVVGENAQANLTRVYASGFVSGDSDVGGLAGTNARTIEDSYWDRLATNQSSAVGTSITAAAASDDNETDDETTTGGPAKPIGGVTDKNRTIDGDRETTATADVGATGTLVGVVGFDTDDGTGRALEMLGDNAPSNMTAFDFPVVWSTQVDDYPVLTYQLTDAAPYSADDRYRVRTAIEVDAPGVLGNDLDPEGDDVSITGVVTAPANGDVTLDGDGSFRYRPDLGYTGEDSFVYEVTDGSKTSTATVTLNVTEPRFAVESFDVSPTTVDEGNTTTVTVELTNPTSDPVQKQVAATVDGDVRASRSVRFGPGETRTVSLPVRMFEPGDRVVSVKDLAGGETVTVLRSPSTATWRSWHLPTGVNFNPRASDPREPVTRFWNTAFPDGGCCNPTGLTVANDTVFGFSYTSTFALDARTGAVKWSNTTVYGTYLGGIAYEDGRVFASTCGGGFHALEAQTGDGVWVRYDIDPCDTAPVAQNGTVFIGNNSGGNGDDFYALDADTGATVWSVNYTDVNFPADFSSVAVANGRVYVPMPNGSLYVHDAATGDRLWHRYVGYTESTPAVANGTVYVTDGGSAPYLQALDAETGRFVWNATAEFAYTGVAVSDGVVVAPTCGDSVFAYDADTGDRLWSVSGTDCAYDVSEPVIVEDTVYTTDYNTETLARDLRTGEVKYRITNPTCCKFTSPTPYRGVLYVADRYDSGGVSAYGGPERPFLNRSTAVAGENVDVAVLKEYRNETVANATVTVVQTGDTLSAGADGVFDYTFPSGGTYDLRITAPNTTINRYVETTRQIEVSATAPPAELVLSGVGTSSPVIEGNDLVVRAVVENVGGQTATQSVNLTVAGAERDSQSVTLAPGESTRVELSWSTVRGDAGSYDATVATADDSTDRPVLVGAASPDIEVDLDRTTGPVEPGEPVYAIAILTNRGSAPAVLQATMRVAGTTVDDSVVVLGPRGIDSAALRWVPTVDDPGPRPISVVTTEGGDGGSIVVTADKDDLRTTAVAAGAVESATSAETAGAGRVAVTLRNVGTEAANDTVELSVDGDPVAFDTVEVPAGENATVAFDTDALADGGAHDLTVRTGDDVVTRTLAPGDRATIDLNDTGNVTDPGDNESDGNVTDPGDGNVTDPGDGNVTDPGDGNVTDPGGNESGNATAPGLDVTDDGNRSTDVDADGVHEDVDGDGGVDTSDVQALLDELVAGRLAT